MLINETGVALIKHYESLSLVAYLCPAGVPTIGWGTTTGVTSMDVIDRRSITVAEAESLFEKDVDSFAMKVSSLCIRNQPNSNELAAMTSLAYNIGIGAFAKSTVLKAHERGDSVAAAAAFELWNKARVNGKLQVLRGLVARRAAEKSLYLEPEFSSGRIQDIPQSEITHTMPQSVESERPMSSSTIVRGGVVAAVTSGLAAVNEVLKEVDGITAATGGWGAAALLLVASGAGCYVVWQRYKMRSKGQA
jgi:lysozyme